MAGFVPLTSALDKWFDKPLKQLPKALHARIKQEFLPSDWDHLSPDQRREIARQLDCQHDPDLNNENAYWEDFYQRMRQLERQIEEWESVTAPSASELAQKEAALKKLKKELITMDQQERLMLDESTASAQTDPATAQRNADQHPNLNSIDKHPTGGGSNLPQEVDSLIHRKLTHLRRQYEKRYHDIQKEAYSKLQADIVENLSAGRKGQAVQGVPLAVYEDLVMGATTLTREWPEAAWQAAYKILKSANPDVIDGDDLQKIMDDHAWPIEHPPPFSLSLVDPSRFKESIIRHLNKYSLTPPFSFFQTLDHAAALAKVSIINTARQARNGVGISIDEYFIARRRDTRSGTIEKNSHESLESIISDCIKNLPNKKDEWFYAIRDMVSEFIKENRRSPNQTEAWSRLYNNPPSEYGITSGKDDGEPSLFMNGESLGKRSFFDRWRRYTRIKPQ